MAVGGHGSTDEAYTRSLNGNRPTATRILTPLARLESGDVSAGGEKAMGCIELTYRSRRQLPIVGDSIVGDSISAAQHSCHNNKPLLTGKDLPTAIIRGH